VNFTLHSLKLRTLTGVVCSLVMLQPAFAGQTGVGLTILVLKGDRVQNVVSQEVSRPIAVRIVDRTGRPLPSVNVQFSAPDSGPGGAFVTDTGSLVVVTDRDGVAVAPPFRANSTPGPYEIGIQASYRGEVSKVTVSQSNMAKKGSSKKILLISAALGGAAAAAFVAKGKGDSTPPPPSATTTPTITFLGGSVGAPQ
jgi:hypothetical protein